MTTPRALDVLALCGSLRNASINAALLRAAARLAAPGADIEMPAWLGRLPLFDPDLEADLPLAVQALHLAVANADAPSTRTASAPSSTTRSTGW